MAYHIFDYGPTGRNILVDDYGRLITNPNTSESGYIYAYGDTGYPLLVDGGGRLLINPSGFDAALSGNYYAKDEHLVSDLADFYNIGEDATRFNTIFALSGNFAGGLSINGQVVDTSAHPIEADAALYRNLYIPDYLSLGSKTSAQYNVAFGWQALQKITNPLENVGLGYKALQEVIGGEYNIGIGSNAGNTIVGGDYNICIGWNSDVIDADQQNATAIGYYAIASGNNQIRLGNNQSEVHCEHLKVQQQLIQRGCYGELYDDNDGGSLITITNAGTFYALPSGYLGQETGDPYVTVIAESGQIRIGSEGAGLYKATCALSYGGTVDILSEAAIHVNDNIYHNLHIKRKLSATGDVGSVSLAGLLRLAENDIVDVRFTSDTNGDIINLNHANLSIYRIAR
jgi:hypothetical protein